MKTNFIVLILWLSLIHVIVSIVVRIFGEKLRDTMDKLMNLLYESSITPVSIETFYS